MTSELLHDWLNIDGKKGVICYSNLEELVSYTNLLLTNENLYEEHATYVQQIYNREDAYNLWIKKLVKLYE